MFAVSALFAFVHPDGDSHLLEERIYLIDAFIEDEARDRCLEKCREEEISYLSASNEQVSVKFRQILHVSPLEVTDFSDGKEIFSRFLNRKQAEALISAAEDI